MIHSIKKGDDMQNISRWPIDVSNYIFTLAEGELENLALVSKDWNDVIKTLANLFFSYYEKNKFLMPYTELAKQIRPVVPTSQEQDQYSIRRINIVFQVVINNALPQKLLIKPNMKTLSVGYLQGDVELREATALTRFAIRVRVPELNTFVNPIEKNLPSLEKAEKIRTWMQDHQKELAVILKLNLCDKKLTVLPKEIKYFTGLTKLDLSCNQLILLPIEIKSLTKLKSLDLSDNRLKTIPSGISVLTKLKCLNLSDNQLTAISSKIRSLTALEYLYLSDNRLKTIPIGISLLTGVLQI